MSKRKTDTPAHFEVIESRKGWRWRLRDGNGEIVAHHEGYTRRHDCLRAIENVRDGAIQASNMIKIVDERPTGKAKKARAR